MLRSFRNAEKAPSPQDHRHNTAEQTIAAITAMHALSPPDSRLGELVNMDPLEPVTYLGHAGFLQKADDDRKGTDRLKALMTKLYLEYAARIVEGKQLTFTEAEKLFDDEELSDAPEFLKTRLYDYLEVLLLDATLLGLNSEPLPPRYKHSKLHAALPHEIATLAINLQKNQEQ